MPFALLVLGLLVGGLVALLALNTASAANELHRHDVAAKDASIAASVEQLNNDVAASEAPGNLARIAAQFGMVPAGNPAFLQIDPDGKVRVLGSPGPASAPAVRAPSTPPPRRTPAKPTATRVPGSKTTSTHAGVHTSPHPTPTPTPTPTPNATTTLPGGTR